MKALFTAALAALALSACTPSDVAFEIDNPTDAPLALRVDGTDYTIPPRDSTPLRLAPGAHTLSSEALGQVDFIVYTKGRGGLINPTLSEYLTANEIYVTSEDKLRNFGSFNAQVDLDGVVFEGPFRKKRALFIDKDWTFGVHEPFPEQQRARVDKSGGRISTKIFNVQDFIAYVEAGSGEPGAYLRQNPAGYRPPATPVTLVAPAALPPLHPAHEAHAAPLRALYARWLQARDADSQRAVQDESFQAQMDFTSASVAAGEVPKEAHEQRNAFVMAFGELLGSSALVPPPAP